VFWYRNCDGRQLARWINEKHPEMVVEKQITKTSKPKEVIVEDNTGIDFTTVTPFTR